MRPRLAVAETKHRTTLSEEDTAQTFSATPPYEALRLFVSFVMSPRDKDEKSHVLMFVDITRAHTIVPCEDRCGRSYQRKIRVAKRKACAAYS